MILILISIFSSSSSQQLVGQSVGGWLCRGMLHLITAAQLGATTHGPRLTALTLLAGTERPKPCVIIH